MTAVDAARALRDGVAVAVEAAQSGLVDANRSLAALQQTLTDAQRLVTELEQGGQPPADPPSDPPVLVPAGANTVRIGAASYPLAAVNPTRGDYPGGRGPDELVAYIAPVAFTVTNAFGTECTVMAGRVIAAVDREAVKQSTGVIVPTGGVVLSGHGRARAWLNQYAARGAVVEFATVDTPTPTPVPGEPADGPLPAWMVGGYWQQYQGPPVATLTAEAPEYNVLFAAFALGGGAQKMNFRPIVQDPASFKLDVAASKARGVLWSLSVGGGVRSEAATVLRTETDARRCFETLTPIIDEYGFQGVDDDLENGPAGFTEAGLTALFGMLRDRYGPGFLLSSTPRPYEDFRVRIAGRLRQAGLLDLLQFQFYDAPEYKDATYLRQRVLKELDGANAAGVPYSAQAIGCITRRGYQYGWNTVDVYRSVVEEARRTRGVRGAFIWETNMDRAEGWSFARQIGAIGG